MNSNSITSLQIRSIPSAETRPLRQQILRPHCTLEELVYEGDNDPLAFHAGVFDMKNKLIGICSIFPFLPKHLQESTDNQLWFRIRGVAVLPEYQGQGIGQKMIDTCLEHVKTVSQKESIKVAGIWCNARVKATGLYKKYGFKTVDKPFEIPQTGPHYYMEKLL